jgi:rhomboid family GlyGly-CTERM serine protease
MTLPATLRKSMESSLWSSLWSNLRPRVRAALPPRPAGLAATLLLLGALHAIPGSPAAWRYERAAVAAGEPWRLATAHLVHYDLAHLALNLAGLALLWWLFARDARPAQWAAVAVASALTVAAGLWFLRPDLAWYLGASGVLHGAWAAAGVAARRRWRLEGDVTLALLAAKLGWEQWRGPLSQGVESLPVIVDAHLYGAFGGLVVALALFRRRQSL